MESKEYLPQLRKLIKSKLTDLEVYVDEELIDYITVLLINKKSAKQMIDDLNLFLNEHSDAFVKWLFKTCEKLQSAKYDEKEKMIDSITKGKTREKKADEVVSKLDKDERKIQASLKRKEEDDYNRSKALKSEKVYEKKEKSKLTSTTAATTTKRPYSSPSPQSLHPSSIHHERDHREAKHYPVVRGTNNSNEDSINRNHHHQTSHESYGGNRKRRTSRKSPNSAAYNSHDGKSDYYHDQRSGGKNRSQTPPHRPERKVAVQKKDEYDRESYSSDGVQHTTSKQQQEGATRDTGKQRHIVVEQTKISESTRDEKDTEISAKSLRDAEPVLIGERIDKIVSEDVLINDHVLKSAIVKIASNKDKNSPHPPNELFLKALQSLDLRYKLKKEGSVIGPNKLPLTLEEVKRYRSTKSIDNTELHQMLAEKIDMHFIGTKKSLEKSHMLAEEDPYSPVRVREPDPSKAALTPPPPQYHPTELGETKPNNHRAEYAQTDEVDEESVVLKPQTTARTLQQPSIPVAQKNSGKTGAATQTRRQPLLGETPQPIPTRDTRFIVTLNDKPFVRNFVGKKMLFSPSSRDRVSSSSANNEEYHTWDDTPPITQSSIVYDGIQVDVAEGEVESFSQATHAEQGTVASNSSMVTLSNQALSAGPNPIHINIHPQLFNMRDSVTKPPGNTPFVPTRKTNIYERLGGANVINDESDDIIMGDMVDEEGIGEMDTSIPIEGHINERCKFWPACKNGDTCLFHHPTLPCKNFPHCTFGDKCLFIHPNCKFDAHCTKKDCPFTHASVRRDLNPKSAPIISPSFALSSGSVGGSNQFSYISGVASSKVKPCKFGPACQNPTCPFMHPPECKFGNMCSRSGCMFTHSVKTYGAANLQNKSRGPALKNKWVNPNLILGQTIPHNPNNNNNNLHPSNDIISTA